MKWLLSFYLFTNLILTGCNTKETADPLDRSLPQVYAKSDFFIFKDLLLTAHPSLTLYKSQQKINALFDSIGASFSGSLSVRDFYNRLYFICNEIGCSHTFLYLSNAMYDTLQKRKFFFPYPVIWIENKLLVNVTGYDLPQGTEIVSVNGMPVKQILQQLSVYNPVEGFHRPAQLIKAAKDFSFQYYLKWGPQQKFSVRITDTLGLSKNIILDPVTYANWNYKYENGAYYFDGTEVDYDLDINDKKGYAVLRLPTFAFDGYQKQIAFENFCANSFELLEKKKNITRLIIDLRENTGGRLNDAFLLFSYLAKKPFTEFEYVAAKTNRLPYRNYLDKDFIDQLEDKVTDDLQNKFTNKRNGYYYYADSLIDTWQPEKHRYNGKVFVITNSTTVSAASCFALMVKKTGIGKIVGEETAGGSYSGNGFRNLEYVLPQSTLKLMFPYAHMVYSIKEDKNTGRGVVPDYIVPDTYSSFKNNSDKQGGYIIDSLILN